LEALKLELELELELLKSAKLSFAFKFDLKFPFETRVCGYGDGLDEVLDRTRRRGCKSEGNGHTSARNARGGLASPKVLPGLRKLKSNQGISTMFLNEKTRKNTKRGTHIE
jgi:hypothetical protein